MKVVLLTRTLEVGGAERQIVELAKGLRELGHTPMVVELYPGGPLRHELEASGIDCADLGKRSRWHMAGPLLRLLLLLRRERPDVLYAFRVTASIMAAIVQPFLRRTAVVWGIRGSKSQRELRGYGRFEVLTFALTRLISRTADLIISNSQAGFEYHEAHGYPADRMVVIENGVDTERFRPDAEMRRIVRDAWHVADTHLLVGRVGRLDPMKDHETFLRAAALVAREADDARFVVVGGGPSAYEQRLRDFARDLDLDERVIWAGHHQDMSAVYNALDVCCSTSSFGEGFPNVLGEAMATGVPCVVTDVGDSAHIVAETGTVAPVRDAQAFAIALSDTLQRVRRDPEVVRSAARRRIVEHFGIPRMVSRTLDALSTLARTEDRRAPT